MTVVKIVTESRHGPHWILRIYDGPDAEHLAYCGALAMTADGARALKCWLACGLDTLVRIAHPLAHSLIIEDEAKGQ